MNNIIKILQKAGLFLFGILLIIWGYKVNATNLEAKSEEEKKNKEAEQPVAIPQVEEIKEEKTEIAKEPEDKKVPVVPKVANEPKPIQQVKPKAVDSSPAKSTVTTPAIEKKVESMPAETPAKVEEPKQTVIETATPEESSGTE